MVETFVVYLRSNDVQHRLYLNMTRDNLDDWISLNSNLFARLMIECDVTDLLDRLVASNCYSSKQLEVWEVCH